MRDKLRKNRNSKLESRNSTNFGFRISNFERVLKVPVAVAVLTLGLLVWPALGQRAACAQSAEKAKTETRNSKLDEFRISNFEFRENVTPRAPNMVHIVARHKDGTIFYDQWLHNLRTNAGINWQYNQMAGTTAAVCTYIALSNSGATPAVTDTSLAGEITTNGLARANATPAHTSNATSYTLSYTWTATGTQSAQNAGMLNASSSGTLCFENTFTQVSLISGDTLTVTWTVNF